MGLRSARTTAVVFIILFLGYYQRWLYVPIIEALSGRLSLDPVDVPRLLEMQEEIVQRIRNTSVISAARYPVDPEAETEAIKLSQMIQGRLDDTQRGQKNLKTGNEEGTCQGPKVVCGAPVDCGLGCQIHYLMTCVMVADYLGRMLVVDWSNWPYQARPWTDTFLPVGTTTDECPVDNETATVVWSRLGLNVTYPETKSFPYKNGFPVPYQIADILKQLPTTHVLWWNGQFAKFVFHMQSTQAEKLEDLKTTMKFSSPTVGILMRRRDRLSEKKVKSSPQSVDKYMTAARRYFSKLEEINPSMTRRVYLATDDKNLVKLVRKRYRPPKWEISWIQLKTEVEDITKDLYLLLQCEFVLCSFSSDICRLVLELKESGNLRSIDRVRSLDKKYLQALPHFSRLRLLQQVI